MRYLAVVVAASAVAGCGAASNRVATPTATPGSQPTARARPPSEPKPGVSAVSEGPPAAWLETEGGSVWLGYSSYCWGTVCADFVAPSCDDPRHTPTITLRRGERVTAHLAFEPTELHLSYLSEDGRPNLDDGQALELSSTPSWEVEREGPFSIFARAKGRDASYVACIESE